MTDEELIEAVARAIKDQIIMDMASAREAATVAIPIAQAPLLARIAELEKALSHIDALDPEHHRMGGICEKAAKGLVLRMGEIARNALRSTQ